MGHINLLLQLVLKIAYSGFMSAALQPNPPLWPSSKFGPPSIMIFEEGDFPTDPARSNIMEQSLNRLSLTQGDLLYAQGHFSEKRYAVLFKPGNYSINLRVGYYVQVLGLGKNPGDVNFTSELGVYCPATDPSRPGPGSLDTFWRSAENIRTGKSELLWAVSQAAPIRRIDVVGDLTLVDGGAYASGGFMSNINVNGKINFGGQQQWFTRNSNVAKGHDGGAWNLVFGGCQGIVGRMPDDLGVSIDTVLPTLPITAEKPFITIDNTGKFFLQIPKIKYNSSGIDFEAVSNSTEVEGVGTTEVSFENVYVANSELDSSDSLQTMIDGKLNILLTPGIYKLNKSLELKENGQVILGIGLATLVAPTDGSPAIYVPPNLSDIRIAGIMLEGSVPDNNDTLPIPGSMLLKWGDEGVCSGSYEKPSGVLSDIFARVGGAVDDASISVGTMVAIHSDFVIGDNLWLWRADHTAARPNDPVYPLVKYQYLWGVDGRSGRQLDESTIPRPTEKYHLVTRGEFPVDHALVVTGNDVIMYGLAAEHTLKDLVVWKGNRGKTYFFQSELPYDATQASYGGMNYSGYKVEGDSQTEHEGHGIGVYCFFRDEDVTVENGISTPIPSEKIKFHNAFSRWLDGRNDSGISHVISGLGKAVSEPEESRLSYYNKDT